MERSTMRKTSAHLWSTILPITRHPEAPAAYKFTIPITAIAFLEDDLLVSGYHEILRWNWRKSQLVTRIAQVGERTYAIEWDRSSERIFVASGTPGRLGEVRVFDTSSFNLLGVPVVAADAILDAALSPTGELLAVGGADARIHIVDNRTLKDGCDPLDLILTGSMPCAGTLREQSWPLPVGIALLSSSTPALLGYWQPTQRTTCRLLIFQMCLNRVTNGSAATCRANFNCGPRAKQRSSTTSTCRVRVLDGYWHTPSGIWCLSSQGLTKVVGKEIDTQLHDFAQPPISAAVHASGRWIATGDAVGRVSVWDTHSARQLVRFGAFPQSPRGEGHVPREPQYLT